MTYRVFYQGRMAGTFASRDAALGFVIGKPDSEEYEILDDSDN